LPLNYGYRPWHSEGSDIRDSPVIKALDEANGKEAEAILRDIELLCFHGLRRFGPGQEAQAPPIDLRSLSDTDDLWEVRIRTPGRSFRLLVWVDNLCREVLLLVLYAKKSKRLPLQIKRLAENRRRDWLRRHKHTLRLV
jgi:hypothetical protein